MRSWGCWSRGRSWTARPRRTARSEGLEPEEGVVWGDRSVDELRFKERQLTYELPLNLSQKTGFYFDQRPLRGRVEQLAKGRRVLDVYSYVGPFAMAAARGGATEVMAVDESGLAMEVAAHCASLNGAHGSDRVGEEHGARGADDGWAEGGLRPGDRGSAEPGAVCQGDPARARFVSEARVGCVPCDASRRNADRVHVFRRDQDLGSDALAGVGARDVGMSATILERMYQGADHPVPAAFGEGLYLKSIIASVEAR